MSEVKRYTLTATDFYAANEGEYVIYTDYAALKRELEETETKRGQVMARNRELLDNLAAAREENGRLREALTTAEKFIDCPEGCEQGLEYCQHHEAAELWREIKAALAKGGEEGK